MNDNLDHMFDTFKHEALTHEEREHMRAHLRRLMSDHPVRAPLSVRVVAAIKSPFGVRPVFVRSLSFAFALVLIVGIGAFAPQLEMNTQTAFQAPSDATANTLSVQSIGGNTVETTYASPSGLHAPGERISHSADETQAGVTSAFSAHMSMKAVGYEMQSATSTATSTASTTVSSYDEKK